MSDLRLRFKLGLMIERLEFLDGLRDSVSRGGRAFKDGDFLGRPAGNLLFPKINYIRKGSGRDDDRLGCLRVGLSRWRPCSFLGGEEEAKAMVVRRTLWENWGVAEVGRGSLNRRPC